MAIALMWNEFEICDLRFEICDLRLKDVRPYSVIASGKLPLFRRGLGGGQPPKLLNS